MEESIKKLQKQQQKMEKKLLTIQKRTFQLKEASPVSSDSFEPTYDIYIIDHELFMEIELPGLTENEVSVELTPQYVKIKGNYQVVPDDSRNYLVRKRKQGSFEYMIPNPQYVTEHDTPLIKNGILFIKFALDLNVTMETQ